MTEAIRTDCGLTNASDDTTAKSGVVSASVTRARVTASQDVDEDMDIAAAIEAGDCRFRLDGIWTEDLPLALDTSIEIDGFSSMSGGSLDPSLLHGTFVTPRTLMIEAEDDASLLTIRDATDPQNVVTAREEDETPLADVFTAGGTRKSYLLNKSLSSETAGTSSPQRIGVDVTRTGRVRIRIEGTNYYRPTTDAFDDKESKSTNAWMIERNLDNLDASLKGYDAYEQDLFQLNKNSKGRVFEAADPEQYTITEKRTVPLGFKLVPEGAQGSVRSSKLIRTEREYQRTVAISLGAKVGFESEAASAAVGADYTESKTEGMRKANARSVMNGYSRHKIYALVLDQPFVRLSDEFVDAIDDARRYGRYDELIERFGTHYPYAVTYGSAAKMHAEFEESQLNEWQSKAQDINGNAAAAIGGFGVSISAGRFEENRDEKSLLNSTQYEEFQAVGGTGSWNQDGFGSGTPYPILADIRPLYQLLSPLNFPG
ncbi:MAG: MAC/perforin domain-containing protein, partial [Pseudomonadota bacterium]